MAFVQDQGGVKGQTGGPLRPQGALAPAATSSPNSPFTLPAGFSTWSPSLSSGILLPVMSSLSPAPSPFLPLPESPNQNIFEKASLFPLCAHKPCPSLPPSITSSPETVCVALPFPSPPPALIPVTVLDLVTSLG